MLKNLHIFLQGKGGIGKSFCACMLAQYLRDKIEPEVIGRRLKIWDSDPNNHTLCSFKALGASYIDLVKNGQNVSIQAYDDIIQLIDTIGSGSIPDEEISAILDTGSSNFMQSVNFLDKNDGLAILQEDYGVNVFIHAPILGGAASYGSCWHDFNEMCQRFKNCDFILWINNYKELVFSGKQTLEREENFKRNKDRVKAIIDLPFFDFDTPNRATLELILNQFLLFDEVQLGGPFIGSDGHSREASRLDVRRKEAVKNLIFNAISVIDGVI